MSKLFRWNREAKYEQARLNSLFNHDGIICTIKGNKLIFQDLNLIDVVSYFSPSSFANQTRMFLTAKRLRDIIDIHEIDLDG